ncbi:hypothetical protein CEXT_507141 [Caerostris extrusa]|uniref:Uncharacterized protein n=1 Tax=Caerostris extrusa TaxID=172846 RepID=A0AAV4UT31_CAEEX|nr:hypothetical protein CEXT_507141 [Caerostris extrusa]
MNRVSEILPPETNFHGLAMYAPSRDAALDIELKRARSLQNFPHVLIQMISFGGAAARIGFNEDGALEEVLVLWQLPSSWILPPILKTKPDSSKCVVIESTQKF